MPSTSAVSKAPGEPLNQFLLRGGVRRRGRFPLPARGCRRCRLARARLSALVTDSWVVSRMLGCFAGVESEDVAEDEDGALTGRQQLQGGDEGQRDGFQGLKPGVRSGCAVGEPLEQDVGVGSSQSTSPSRVGAGGSSPGGGALISGRRLADRSASRQRLVATWYSQVRTEARPSNPARPCQADSKVSCSASSASCTEPRIR